MGCAQGTLKRAGSVKARDRSLAVMKSLFPVAFADAYEVDSKATFDAYGGAFDVVSREDGSARTAVLARLKKQADGECLTISQFSMEEYVLQLLRHDGVASVYESFTELRKRPAMGVLIVDRLRGAKLIDYLQQKDGAKLGEDEAREIMVQLASVLKHLVDCGVTCGNLDLDTLVFREEDNMELVVTSMRYASLAGHPSSYVVEYGTYEIEDELGQPVTRTFPEDARKLHFAAPERLKPDSRGRDRQPSVDVWSFGVIMYTLLAGYLPFEGEDSRTLCEKIRQGNFTAFKYDVETWDSISMGAKDLIAGCLRVDPRRRFNIERILKHPWIRKFEDPNATFIALGSESGLGTPPRSYVSNSSDYGDLHSPMH
jgi:serine/threonine protein kinase